MWCVAKTALLINSKSVQNGEFPPNHRTNNYIILVSHEFDMIWDCLFRPVSRSSGVLSQGCCSRGDTGNLSDLPRARSVKDVTTASSHLPTGMKWRTSHPRAAGWWISPRSPVNREPAAWRYLTSIHACLFFSSYFFDCSSDTCMLLSFMSA